MNRIKILFDYIYYRLNKFYYKWDGENGTTSVIGLSMFQSMLIGNTITILLKLFLTKEDLKSNSKALVFLVITIFVALEIYNYFKYKNKYQVLKEYWKDETKKQRIERGIWVIVALLIPWVMIIGMSFV